MPRLIPPQIYAACLIGLLVTHLMVNGLVLPALWLVGLGGLVVALGGLVALSGVRRFLRGQTTFHPHETPTVLVREGIYRRTRNPMYLGLLLSLCGLVIALNCLICALFPLLFFALISSVILPVEERRLTEAFGAEYEAYCRATRRWI